MTAPYDDQPPRPTFTDTVELEQYRSTTEEPSDFDEFWQETLSTVPRVLRREPVDIGLPAFEIEDLRFQSFDGTEVAGWVIRPAHTRHALPAVVTAVGYGHGRGEPHEHLIWPSAGYATFVLDPRGQGGPTGDGLFSGSAVARGIESPRSYYYRRVIADFVALLDIAATDSLVDASNITVVGTSQAGGLALAATGLRTGIRAAIIEIPFLCDWSRGIDIADRGPYADVVEYGAATGLSLQDVRRTLAYFDGVSFAARATAPALFSVALRDRVCPPSTVYAAFNEYAGSKNLTVLPFNGHEGGGPVHTTRRVRELHAIVADGGQGIRR